MLHSHHTHRADSGESMSVIHVALECVRGNRGQLLTLSDVNHDAKRIGCGHFDRFACFDIAQI